MTIPNKTRARIVGMCQGGMKGVKIADKVGVLVMIVQRIVKQFKEDGNFKSHTICGRPKLLSERDARNVILFLRFNRRASLTKITNACPVLVSTMTVCCTLHDNGVFSRIAVKKKHS
jgi:transposase